MYSDAGGEKRLVSYLVLRSDASLKIADIRRRLREHIPEFMIPSAFVFLEKLPLTQNAKVDRSALPTPTVKDMAEKEYVAPTTRLERAIVKIVAEILSLDASLVGMSDNFFDLGGHSLSAAQLLSRVQETWQVDLSLRTIFDAMSIRDLTFTLSASVDESMVGLDNAGAPAPSVTDASERKTLTIEKEPVPAASLVKPVARRLKVDGTVPGADEQKLNDDGTLAIGTIKEEINGDDADAVDAADAELVVLQAKPVRAPATSGVEVVPGRLYELSYNQQSLLFVSSLDPNGWSSLAYNIPFATKFLSPVNEMVLVASFKELIEHHTALRTRYFMPGAAPEELVNKTNQLMALALVGDTSASGSGSAQLDASRGSQVIDPFESYQLDYARVDASKWSDADLSKWMLDETYRPFDLRNGPIMRVRFLERTTGAGSGVITEQFLLWTVHHIAVDLWSFVVLLDDLAHIYASRARRALAAQPPLQSSHHHSSHGHHHHSVNNSRTASPDSALTGHKQPNGSEPDNAAGAGKSRYKRKKPVAHVHAHNAQSVPTSAAPTPQANRKQPDSSVSEAIRSASEGATLASDVSQDAVLLLGDPLQVRKRQRQYVECIPAQKAALEGVSGERLWSFWQNLLREPLPVLELPTDRQRPAVQSYEGTSFLAHVPAPLLKQLRALARSEGVTMYVLLLSAYYALLHHYTGQEDIIVGSPMAGRSKRENDHAAGSRHLPSAASERIVGLEYFSRLWAALAACSPPCG